MATTVFKSPTATAAVKSQTGLDRAQAAAISRPMLPTNASPRAVAALQKTPTLPGPRRGFGIAVR